MVSDLLFSYKSDRAKVSNQIEKKLDETAGKIISHLRVSKSVVTVNVASVPCTEHFVLKI